MGQSANAAQLAWRLVCAGFDFDKLSYRWALDDSRSGAELAAFLLEHADSRWTPPGGTPTEQLVEILVHSVDALAPTGCPLPPVRVVQLEVLDLLESAKGERGYVPKGALEGLSLQPTDVERKARVGAAIVGPVALVASAACGRRTALDALTGDGVAILAQRLT